VAAQIKAVTELGLDPRNFILCTDDSHSGTLVHDGHMNRVVRHAISQGLKPITAIQMATINTAQHFGLERELGSITPGRRADLVLSSDLAALPIDMVVARGRVVAEEGKLVIEIPAYGVVENQAPTKALERKLKAADGVVEMDRRNDVCQIAVVERHRGTGEVANGFVSGFGYLVNCAVASTVAHDSHHMIVVGTHKADMALAANLLGEVGGGIAVVSEGRVLALVELPIAGLMSDERAEAVAEKARRMIEAMRECGCTMNNAYMQHSLLALVVIPELRMSDAGLIDVRRFEKTDVLVS
jgi:adenine deaminase